jgi:transcription antitermination factor NusG
MDEAEKRIQWYALRTKPRHEKVAALMLQHKGYESFLPLYQSRRRRTDRYIDIELPIFPGYMFCRFDPTLRLPILTTPGVLHVVGIGRMPVPVADGEIDGIRTMVASSLPLEPWPYPELGQRVYIRGGPLQGLMGILAGVKNKHRLVLSVTLLRRAVAVEIERGWAAPAPPADRTGAPALQTAVASWA